MEKAAKVVDLKGSHERNDYMFIIDRIIGEFDPASVKIMHQWGEVTIAFSVRMGGKKFEHGETSNLTRNFAFIKVWSF
jgi:hypothetical protein